MCHLLFAVAISFKFWHRLGLILQVNHRPKDDLLVISSYIFSENDSKNQENVT